jgi:hypothetical protein
MPDDLSRTADWETLKNATREAGTSVDEPDPAEPISDVPETGGGPGVDAPDTPAGEQP